MKILNDLEEKEKKALIIIAIVFMVVLATGFLLWRVNQKAKLSSDESEAASNLACGEYGCSQDSDCKDWTPGGDYECDEVMSHKPSEQRCERKYCPTGYKRIQPCTCELIVVNTCEGGNWVRRPTTFVEDETFTISGYGEDTDGINANSIDVKIDGTSISGHKISKEEDGDRTDWSTTLSDLSVGSHTIVVSWEDGEGEGGDDCTLTSTFVITAAEPETPTPEPETPTPTPETVPQTGLLDEAWGKVALGFGILGMGMILMKYNIFEFEWNGVEIRSEGVKRKHSGRLKNEFERKVVKDK